MFAAPIIVVRTGHDALVELIVRAPKDGQIYMLRPRNIKTVFDITRLNAVGECKGSLLSLHIMAGCDATSAFYNQWKDKAYKLFKEHTDVKKCNCRKCFPGYHKWFLLNR